MYVYIYIRTYRSFREKSYGSHAYFDRKFVFVLALLLFLSFLVITGSLHVRRGTRKSACGNEKHARNSRWPRLRGRDEEEEDEEEEDEEGKAKRRDREKKVLRRDSESRYRELRRKNPAGDIRMAYGSLELETLPRYREEKSPEGVSDLGTGVETAPCAKLAAP